MRKRWLETSRLLTFLHPSNTCPHFSLAGRLFVRVAGAALLSAAQDLVSVGGGLSSLQRVEILKGEPLGRNGGKKAVSNKSSRRPFSPRRRSPPFRSICDHAHASAWRSFEMMLSIRPDFFRRFR
ncbi:hypothetical protein [Shinella granuli]|uniref:hypothetical protein n=1 Tax=Shinella granuli TaxID=323621 RepID=UPI0031E955A3